jgi:AraC-like DNA-binding protein
MMMNSHDESASIRLTMLRTMSNRHSMPLPPHTSGRGNFGKQRISFSDGAWRLHDGDDLIGLNHLIASCQGNVNQLAESLGMKSRDFRRLVYNSLGINPKEWLRRIRAVAAMKRLRGGIKIECVARELGFRHASDFTDEFKSVVGVTPTAYVEAETSRMFPPHRAYIRSTRTRAALECGFGSKSRNRPSEPLKH